MKQNCFLLRPGTWAIIICLILSQSLTAQVSNPAMGASPWKFANPQPFGYTYSDMSFINDNVGLAVSGGALGGSGAIMRTTDGGRNWQAVTFKYVTSTGSVQIAGFNDVHFVTPTIAYAVGGGGLMIKSTDGGLNWVKISTPLTNLGRNINALHFINRDTGYIGGAAINTTNTTNINDAPKVYVTRNGGSTWDSLATPFRPQQNNVTLSGFNQSEIQRIHFANDSVGYVVGSCGNSIANYSAIVWKIEKNVVKDYSLHRSKFGISATTGSYTPATQTYKGVVGINDSLVLVSSLNNNVVVRVRTGKNDSTASAAPAVFGAYERGVYEIVIWLNSTATPFPANLVGNIAGQMQQLKKDATGKIYMTSGSSILFSNDNGTSWSFTKPHPSTVVYPHWGFNAIDVTPNRRIVIGTFNGLTYDSLPGATGWQSVYSNIRPLFYGFNDMDWADYCNGIAVGSNGSIAKTSDGGKTWVNASNPLFDAAQIGLTNVFYHATNAMYFSTNSFGFIGIHRSTDQGQSYLPIFTETNPNTFGIANFTMVGQSRAWAVGYRGSPAVQRTVIFRSLNANAVAPTWDTVKAFPNGTFAPQLRKISFANQDTGYTCGNRGKVYRTIDGGTTWTDISPDTLVNSNGTNNYTALSVVNGKTIFIGGSSRKLFRSVDAGATWTDLTIAVPAAPTPITAFTSITNIVMNDATNGYLNAGNIVMKTADAWATWTYDLSPGSFVAMSLYPKIAAPISNKKLYGLPLVAGTSVNSTQTAGIIEYGDVAAVNISSTETVTSSCSNASTGSVIINATGAIVPYTYRLNNGTPQSSGTFSNIAAGTYTITINDAACATLTKQITVGVRQAPGASAGPDKLIVSGDEVTLDGSGITNPTLIAWTPATSITSGANTYTPSAKPTATTNYTVTVTDPNGCTASDNTVVTVLPYCIKPMDAFTPNGDGINDKWLATTNSGSCTSQVIVNVFNRYGNLVYSNENYQNDWNGTYKGKPVPDGTYYYVIKYKLVTGNGLQLKGDVTILR
jgi:gliding motility-associated-like protein